MAQWRPDRKFPIDMAGFAVNVNEACMIETSDLDALMCMHADTAAAGTVFRRRWFAYMTDMCRA